MKILAPAKINIGLRIIRKRPDNYHDIETVFYPIHLSDEIEIIKSDKLEFLSSVAIPSGPSGKMDANLCLRALHFFCERTGIHSEVRMKLRKNIPIGSGLGGGSSDAAAVLLALQEIYEHPLSEIELFDIARILGSDVPFFLNRTPAYATGRGDIIEPIKYSVRQFILTLVPEVSVSTSLAYSIVTPTGTPAENLRDLLRELKDNYSRYTKVVANDFEKAIFEKFPAISQIKGELDHHGAVYSSMSGSGSSVYGLFATGEEARGALDAISARHRLQAADITPPSL